jgi:hypothetical protein
VKLIPYPCYSGGMLTTQQTQELKASKKFQSYGQPRPHKLETFEEQSPITREQHFTVTEVAELWGVSPQTIRDIFREEEGVLRIGKGGTRYIRCACPIWIDWSLPDGTRVRKSLKIRDWQAGQRRAREMEAEGIVSVGQPVTVRNAVNDFLKDVESVIQPPTKKQYRILLERLNAFCQSRGLIFLRQLGVVEVREFRNSWTTYSPRTAGKHIERLKRFFSWCVENRWLESSPAKPLKTPKVGETDVVPFTEEEIKRIMKACESYRGDNRERLILLTKFLLSTGLRIGDAVTIGRDKFIEGKDGWMVEPRTQKTGHAVSIPIQDHLGAALHKLGEHPFWTGKSDVEDAAKN